ncbi:MAG: type I methionyl aminopeptidase [Patescibacteria group bacterium]|jgi:methionyl aminopeptidase
MITTKTEEDIKKLAYSGRLLGKILKQLVKAAKPGVSTQELDMMAEDLIRRAGGRPAFKGYQGSRNDPPFPSTICASVNNELVHAPASARRLKDGDILSIDIGMNYEDLYTDMATTAPIGHIPSEIKRLLRVTEKSLTLGIKQVKPGNFVHDISRAVQTYVEGQGMAVVKDLFGHGVGYAVHEDPRIPNFLAENQPRVELRPGMVIAIEPMVSLGTDKIATLDDEWTVVTADGKLCAHFEHTVAVTAKGHLILTK